jgi:hypothetical protein
MAQCTFKFIDENLNRKLLASLKRASVSHQVTKDGTICFSPDDEEIVENELLKAIRDHVYDHWQILSCPKTSTDAYKAYMVQNEVPFVEELSNGELGFLLPRKYRPHNWKLTNERRRVQIAG